MSSLNKVLILLVVIVGQPVLRGVYVWLAAFLKLALFYKCLFSLGSWTLFPFTRIGLSVHYHSLCLRHNSVITAANLSGCHLRNRHCHSLALCWHYHDLCSNVNIVIISQNTGNHKFGTITDGIDWWVLYNDSRKLSQQNL
jgi:hypothetical protein